MPPEDLKGMQAEPTGAKSVDDFLDEYFQLDYEDIIGRLDYVRELIRLYRGRGTVLLTRS